ncbi:alpha/beta-hydrolase [Gigaspora margarita]|uniref:Alpha/beta-hydrolase n=2 Tax=Gigaspora margarita TaxID=4874 RepID=A0A8H4AGV8_GIGMA|nr:alpha/beta-hydrolase [Gigaspora margarita]
METEEIWAINYQLLKDFTKILNVTLSCFHTEGMYIYTVSTMICISLALNFFFHANINDNNTSFSYGRSEGTPSEKGLRIDAQVKLIIYGQSLGGAVAIDLVSKNEEQVDALIIENTFLSVPKLVPHLVPQLRYLTFLCIQIWPSDKSIKKIKQTPILFLSGTKDEIIPQQHMKSLYELAQPRGGKEWKEFSNGMHNDTILQPGYFQNIGWFIKRNVCLDE